MTRALNWTHTTAGPAGPASVLEVKDLHVHYATPTGDVIAVNGANLTVYEGETVGLVGESGCGKTTLAMAILRLVQPPGRIVSGQVRVMGTDMVALSEEELRRARWSPSALDPQSAMKVHNTSQRGHGSNIHALTAQFEKWR